LRECRGRVLDHVVQERANDGEVLVVPRSARRAAITSIATDAAKASARA
jgi:hypothetical protein